MTLREITTFPLAAGRELVLAPLEPVGFWLVLVWERGALAPPAAMVRRYGYRARAERRARRLALRLGWQEEAS